MATESEIRQVAQALRELGRQIQVCVDVGEAMVEVELPLMATWRLTDFERARNAVIAVSTSVRRALRRVRRTTVSGSLIRAAADVEVVVSCCRRCIEENRRRQQNGEDFICLVKAHETGRKNGRFQFQLDEKGRVHERAR